ncbi:MAG: signal peptidase II [Chloroflexia bacterium]
MRSSPGSGRLLLMILMVVAAALVFALDQATKAWIATNMVNHGVRPIIAGMVRLRYTENTGAAFGLFQGGTLALSIAAAAIIAVIVLSITRMGSGNPLLMLGLALVLGGAIGNLVDRVRLGYVVDFVEVTALRADFSGTVYTFPVFNVADSAITVGVILIMAALLFGTHDARPQTSAPLED